MCSMWSKNDAMTAHSHTDGASGPHRLGGTGGDAESASASAAAANVVWIAYEGVDGEKHCMTREDFLAFEEGQIWGMMMEFFPWDEIPKGKRNRQLPTARKPRGKIRPFVLAAGELPQAWQGKPDE